MWATQTNTKFLIKDIQIFLNSLFQTQASNSYRNCALCKLMIILMASTRAVVKRS